ncbi:hypothetical protein BGW38_000919 [Lunasporangiospora selenospora]|uniref:Uncharacterized protein n=1 Tax=Lunasporangiospora selenospora TaxID=979761 RepID=A0A9P6FUX9_9FUNG|nr:hypothetical protein BGW38_000919 [Lunasporangiospora selenospora]
MLVYITVCSLIGSLSVVATQGLGAAIVLNITTGTPQFNHWFIYVTIVFVLCTLLTEINYLNKALNLFNTAVVTPVYYVFFTSATLIASVILFQGFSASPVSILTVVMGFFVICAGVVLLQTSKSAVLAEFALKKSKSFTEFVTVSSALSFTDHHHHHQHFSTDDGILSGSGDARDIHKDETDGLDPGPLGLRAVPFDAIRQMVRASTMPSSPASFVEKENHRLFGKKRRRRSTRGELDLDLGPDSHDDHGFSTSRVLSNSALDEMAASGDSEKMLERDYVERTRSFRLEERVLDPPVNIPEGDQQHWNHSDVEHPDLVDTEDILSDQEHGPSGNGSSEKRTDKGMSP